MKRIVPILCGVLCLWALLPGGSIAAPAPTPRAPTSHVTAHKVFYPTPQYVRAHPEIGKTEPIPLIYNDGPVMPDVNIYVIFWGTGFTTAYENVVTNYFTDVSNTSFENVLNQYYDTNSHIHNSVTLKATWADTATPPTTSTSCQDLNSAYYPTISDGDIANEVAHAISTEGWATDHANGLYFVYTPPNDGIYAGSCSYTDFCAYHTYSGFFGSGVAYASMPFPTPPSGSLLYPCYGVTGQVYPNGDTNGDAVVNVSSHEQFEAQSDQFPDGPGAVPYTGWVDTSNGEIGDKCAWTFPGGGSTAMNNGHSYGVQLEFSNASDGCVNTFTTPAHWPDTGGVYRPSNGNLFLKLANNTGVADMNPTYGIAGDKPVVGDWTGKGYRSIGVYRGNQFLLRNSNTTGNADIVATFGSSADLPVAGDWTGQGKDTIGVFHNGHWALRNSNTAGTPDIVAFFGTTGDIPVVGDWTGQGKDTIGVYRPSTGTFYLSNSNTSPAANIVATFGPLNALPVVGDWDGNGTTTIGVDYNGHFKLRNSNTSGIPDITYYLGTSTDQPFAGDWIAN